MKSRHLPRRLILSLLLLLLVTVLPAAWAQETPALERAWRTANAIGRYDFRSTIRQTTTPLPRLINAGLTPVEERLYVQGSAAIPDNRLHLKIWSQGGSTQLGSGALEVRIIDGRSQGRVGDGPWQTIDDVTNLFAPGQDPLGFLHAASAITPLGSDRAAGLAYTRYGFTLDGPAYAAYMRAQAVAELTRRGELPAGLTLGPSRGLAQLTGSGEIWLAADGLPLRQIIHLTLPPGELEQVTAVITTDFSDWGAPPATTTLRNGLASWGNALRQTAQAQAVGVLLVGTAFVLTLLLVARAGDRRLYRLVAGGYAAIVLLTPPLQIHQARAQAAAADAFRAVYADPATAEAQPAAPVAQAAPDRPPTRAPAAVNADGGQSFADDGSDGDGDGITDAVERNLTLTNPAAADSDGDGLQDGVELFKLGTDPLHKDSDGDGLDDANEVNGFTGPDGRHWVLDPRATDTNSDGEPDLLGCTMNGSGLTCLDSDGDQLPDVFDDDDDNDGVPDSVDSAATTYFGDPTTGFAGGAFEFDLNGIAANQSLFVDLQLRPTNPDHLWYSLSVLDWPTGDREGQVQRVNDDPFAASGRLANGDMQLTPLLQVELSGTPLPLPLTTPAADVAFDDGTLTLTQEATQTRFSFAFNSADSYDAEVVAARCGDIESGTAVLHSFSNVTDGSTTTLTAQLVETIATGGTALRVTNRATNVQSCTTIPNVVNGAYSDRMVDLAKLRDYRITVREMDAAGRVYMLVPLTLLYEFDNNMPVAFGARLFYQPEAADFGNVQAARLIWTVGVKEERCLPLPADYDPNPATSGDEDESASEKLKAWCGNDANWAGIGTSIVQTYPDSFYLTGMKVQRNLGFAAAAIFQSPAHTVAQPDYVANGFNEADLWTLARGLDVTYMSARSADNATRDLTLDDVAARFDNDLNAASTPAERFGLPAAAFEVERFDYADESGLGYLAQQDIYGVLESVFTPQVAGGVSDPTVLYLHENTIRAMSIDDPLLVERSGGNRMTLSVGDAALPSTLIATMNWVPYQWQPDGWAPYDLTEFWDDKGAQITALLSSTWPPDLPDRANEIDGASLLARIFFMTLLQGSTRALEINGAPTDMQNQVADGEMLQYLYPQADPDLSQGELISGLLTEMLNGVFYLLGDQQWSLGGGLLTFSRHWTDLTDVLLGQDAFIRSGSEFSPRFAVMTQQERLANFNNFVKLRRTSENLSVGAAMMGTVATATALAGMFTDNPVAAEALEIVTGALGVVTATLTLAATITEVQLNLATTPLKTLLKGFEITKAAYVFLAVGVAIGIGMLAYEAVARGLKVGSLALNQLVVDFIAGIIVTVLLFVISAIPVVGQLIAIIIAVIDAIITFICSLVPESVDSEAGAKARDYLCEGISGLIGKVIAWLLYDQTPMVDLTRDGRLNVTNIGFELTDPDSGYRAGNHLRVWLDVQTALYAPKFTIEDFSLFSVYRWMFNDTSLKKTTLGYQFVEETAADRAVGDMQDQWQPVVNPADDFFAPDADFYTTIALDRVLATPLSAGINTSAAASLVERQYYLVQECSVPVICWTRNETGEVPLNLGSYFTFDVFPSGVDGFRALEQPAAGQYKLDWSDLFPILKDADGDGLRNAVFGGADPDDGSPDADGDGLSDYYERLVTNSDPLRRDSDDDGLCDDQEVRYGSDPLRADSDGDGLLDAEEVFHQDVCDGDGDADTTEWLGGWQFVYDYDANNAPLRTLVTSDPNAPDVDGDLYPDVLEKLYGFNPNVASSGDIMNIAATVSNPFVRPGGTLDYRVRLENALDTSFALGLLDVAFNADVQADTLPPLAFNLRPQEVEETSGGVTIRSDISSSRVVSLTNVAGASIVNPLTEVGGRSVWLRFEEPADATSFADSSLNAFDFGCTNAFSANCPVSGEAGYRGSAIRPRTNLVANSGLQGATNALAGVTPGGFTADLWFKVTSSISQSPTLLDVGGMSLQISPQQAVRVVTSAAIVSSSDFAISLNTWTRLSLRYQNGTIAVFRNGTHIAGSSQPDSVVSDAANLPIRVANFVGTTGMLVDDVSIYPFALGDSQVAALANERVFYLSGERIPTADGSSEVDDSPFRNVVTCREGDNSGCPQSAGGIYGYINNGVRAFRNGNEYGQLEVGPAQNLDLSLNGGRFTIAAWVDPTLNPSYGTGNLLGRAGDGETYYYPTIAVNKSDGSGTDFEDLSVRVVIRGADDRMCEFNAYGPVLANRNWNQIVVTFDGSRFTAYVNGVRATGQGHIVLGLGSNLPDCNGVTPRPANSFYVGGAAGVDTSGPTIVGNQVYTGNFDEVQIFNHVRTPEQIEDLYWRESPILDLRLDDYPTATTFKDRSPAQFSVTCSGSQCPLAGLPGRDLQAVRFDGTDDRITLPTLSELEMDDSFTLAGWIKLEDIHYGAMFKTSGSDALFLGSGGTVNGPATAIAVIGSTILPGPTTLPADRWVHLALRYSSAGSGSYALFVDGGKVAEVTGVTPSLPLSAPLVAGVYYNEAQPRSMTGSLDRLQVFRDALTDAEVAALVRLVPLLNLHLDDAAGSTALVNSGHPQVAAVCTDCGVGTQGRMYGGTTRAAESAQALYSSIQSGPNVLALDRFTAAVWVRPTQMQPAAQALLVKDGFSNNLNYGLYIAPNSMKAQAALQLADCLTSVSVTSQATLLQNGWNHVLMTYDGAELRLYVNGALDGRAPAASVCTSDWRVNLGHNRNEGERLIGQLDEALIYPVVLSNDEIRDLYNFQTGWYDVAVEQRITIDADAPVVGVALPTGYVQNVPRILAITAVDATSAVRLVEVSINNGGWQPAAADGAAWLFTFQPAGSGSYNVRARATDMAGNETLVNGGNLLVDASGPQLQPFNIESLTNIPVILNPATREWRIFLAGNVTVEGAAFVRGEVALFDSAGRPVTGWRALAPVAGGSAWQDFYPFSARPNGVYTVTVRAQDAAGNRSTRSALAQIDGTPPAATLNVPAVGATLATGETIGGTLIETDTVKSGVAGLRVSFHVQDALQLSGAYYHTDGLRLHLPLDEAAGPSDPPVTFGDRIDGRTATCSNCPATGLAGEVGGAPQFDGSNDSATVTDLGSAFNGGAFAFGGWVRPLAGTGGGPFLTVQDGGDRYSLEYDEATRTITFFYLNQAIGRSDRHFALGAWHHVMVVGDPGVGGRLFVNGQQMTVFGVGDTPGPNSTLTLGGGDGSFFAGQIDDVVVYDRMLDATLASNPARYEVNALRRGGHPLLHLTFDDLVLGGGSVGDQSRNGWPVTVVAGSAQPTLGIVGATALAGGATLQTTQPDLSGGRFTVIAWVSPNAADGTLIGGPAQGGPGSEPLFIERFATTRLRIGFGNGSSRLSYETGAIVTANQWNMVGVTFDGTTLRVYINGFEVESTTAFSGQRPAFGGGTLEIGNAGGALDEVLIVPQAYSAEQIVLQALRGWGFASISRAGRADTATWSLVVPNVPDNVYEIQLQTADVNGNVSYDADALPTWAGRIAMDPTAVGLVAVGVDGLRLWPLVLLLALGVLGLVVRPVRARTVARFGKSRYIMPPSKL